MEFSRVLQYRLPLDRGEDVRAVQQALLALNTQPSCGVADGVFGFTTQKAVSAFQAGSRIRLDTDGKVGADTWAALFHQASVQNAPSVLIRGAGAALSGRQKPGSVAGDPPPMNSEQSRRVKEWLMAQFGPAISAAVAHKPPLDEDVVCAIACKETAIMWLGWADRKMDPAQLLASCVFDASGDDPRSPRSVFPVNTAAFRVRFGDSFTEDLIARANRSRQLRGLQTAEIVYKGYGIFRYHLQNVVTDEAFFRQAMWGDFAACLDRFMRGMDSKLAAAGGDLFDAVRRYNGSGARAQQYATHVMQMREWCAGRP